MRVTVRLLPVLLIAALALPARAATPGFAFLNVPVGARGAALGGAYASVATGADAAFWNPSALADLSGAQLSGSHVEFLSHLRHEQAALAGHLLGGGLAASMRAMYSEPIPQLDDLGNQVGTFGTDDLEFGLAYGHHAGAGLPLGGSAQLVHERLADAGATTWSFGLSSTFEPARVPGLRFALTGDHLGPAARYTIDGTPGEAVDLPAALQAGGSYAHPVGTGFSVLGSLETRMTRGRAGVAMVGAELSHLATGLSLRAGARLNDPESALAFGAGCAVQSLHVDYAFVPFRLDLGDTHRFSLSARF